jgi:hypothetical protein
MNRAILFCAIIMFVFINPTTSKAEDEKCAELKACALKNIPSYDDKVSPAQTIADAVMAACEPETRSCVARLKEVTKRGIKEQYEKDGILKQYPHFADNLDAELSTPEQIKNSEALILEKLITPQVLKYRVKMENSQSQP